VRIPVLAGIWPFESALNAEFMANEVPGVTVPDALVDRMRRTATAAEAAAEGVRIGQELVARLAPMIAGVQVYSPSGRLELALGVLDAVG
jgi:5,10-methylenetetrahydrofolate reductase